MAANTAVLTKKPLGQAGGFFVVRYHPCVANKVPTRSFVFGNMQYRQDVTVVDSETDPAYAADSTYFRDASGGVVPFVGASPPSSPTDGELWWDTDDATALGGAQPFLIVRKAFVYNTPSLRTGILLYTPTPGDITLNVGVLSVTTAWNGTTPTCQVFPLGGDVQVTAIFSGDMSTPNIVPNVVWQNPKGFPDALPLLLDGTPMMLNVDDGAGGDPGSTQGVALATIIVLLASA